MGEGGYGWTAPMNRLSSQKIELRAPQRLDRSGPGRAVPRRAPVQNHGGREFLVK